jgi:DNA-binding XRE family transcriptional regulator
MARRMPQAELADLLGISQSTVSEIESGRKVPSADLADSLAWVFDCQVETILSGRYELKPVESDGGLGESGSPAGAPGPATTAWQRGHEPA